MDNRFRLASLAFVVLLVPAIALAYPISPQPLWSLTSQAQVIVVAQVAGVDDLPPDEDRWVSAAADLVVLETLKGPELESIEVHYAANMICPAPARYLEGETVVAFLTRDEEGWRTVGLSYGTLYPQGLELDDMRVMIEAALALQGSPAQGKLKERRKREWLVQAAALPGTRWHGLYELAPGSDRVHSFYDRSGRPDGFRLTRHHRAILAEAFVTVPKMDRTLAMMLRVLGSHDDPRIDPFALGALEGLLTLDQPPWWARDLLWAILVRFGDTELEGRLDRFGVEPWDATTEQLRRLWADAKSELAIPDVAPADVKLERYLPVGGRTPS